MSVNNKQRRAAKKRQRESTRRSQETRGGSAGWSADPFAPFSEGVAARVLMEDALAEVETDLRAAARLAPMLTRPGGPVGVIAVLMDGLMTSGVAAAADHGWSPEDLAQVVKRRLSALHLSLLADLLTAYAARHPGEKVHPEWRRQLTDLGPCHRSSTSSPKGMELALGLVVMLSTLPAIQAILPPPGVRAAYHAQAPLPAADARLLAKVRSLLAKAESTKFPEEAEALSAKAQELISRYALDHLLDRLDHHEPEPAITAQRLWIDAPYVLAKAMLVGAVAAANRCRTVTSESLGFVTVVGERSDLKAVEILATSLLVQANAAMLGHGQQTDRFGSRTTSFRRSFLIAYASRISERLRSATQHASEGTGRSAALVPALRDHSGRVDAAMSEMFPDMFTREATVSNRQGWAAGRSAADRARLGEPLPIGQ